MEGNRCYKKTEWLEFTYKNSGEAIRFPVGIVKGKADGPTLVVVGGMHGSEFCGVQAAIDLFKEVDPEKLKGTLIVGTIYNLPAFVNHTGFVVPQDGKNPMSTFPGKLDGTYGEVMAHHFNEKILSQADYFIELHGGDIPEALTPFIMCPLTGIEGIDHKIKDMALAYNIPLIIERKVELTEKLGSAFVKSALRGVPSILTESGQQGILDLEAAKIHLNGLRNVMITLNMLEGERVNDAERIYLESHGAVRSEWIGMWYPFVKLNDRVRFNQIVGEIRDYFGQVIAEVKSPIDGLITVIRTSPSVALGNVLIELHKVI